MIYFLSRETGAKMTNATKQEGEEILTSLNEPDNPKSVVLGNEGTTAKAGELNYEEYTRGGMGRHLGTFSTIFLMYVHG